MTQLLNTRILVAVATIVFVGAVAASATGAFFSDTETSTGNTFAAGELDLKIDNSSYGFDWNDPTVTNPTGVWGPNAANSWQLADLTNQLFFSFADLKPGDYGEDTISLHVQNNAYACMRMDLTSTPDNGINEPEGDAGDVTDGANAGELQNFLSFMFWNDDGDNVYEEGETIIDALTGLPGEIFTGNWLTIADSQAGVQLAAGTTTYLGKGWCFGTMTATPAETPAENPGGPTPGNTGFTCSGADPLEGPGHNVAQTDGIVVDVEFYATQSRNNGDFLCSRLNETLPEATTLTLEKVIQQDGINVVTEALWTLTASGTSVMISGIETAPAVTAAPVPPGDYVLSETVVQGFTQSNLQCVGGTLVGNTVTVPLGANVVCTFTNTEDGPPSA